MTEILHALNSIVGLNQLLENFTAKVREIFRASAVYLILFEPITRQYLGKMARGNGGELLGDFSFAHTDNLIRWLNVNRSPLDLQREKSVVDYLLPRERDLLGRAGIRLCIPLIVGNRLTGTLLLAGRDDGSDYTRADLDALTMLTSQSALAIENATMYEFQEDKLKKLFHADKLTTVGELAAGAAHEIRNPLTSIRSTVQYLGREIAENRKDLIEGIICEVDRIDQVIAGLLSFSRTSELKSEVLNIQEVLDQVLLLLDSEMRRHRIGVTRRYLTASARISGDPAQLKQVFVNILMNSIQAMPSGGEIQVSTGNEREAQRGAMVRVEIADTGPGIPEENIPRAFQPFFTTKEEGTGLGLSIAYGIVKKHRGDIEIFNMNRKGEQGTLVRIRLPQSEFRPDA
ncbi:MAG TPA: ATP-binding protein [Bacteroidota bacterium]|nr:ATP-binding protein [Bacteroidota bacterium]